MVQISVTVKTLDGSRSQVDIDDAAPVSELKTKVAAAARAEAERPPTPSGHGEWRKLSLQVKRRISRGGFVYEHAPMQPGYLFVLGVWLFAFVVGW